MNEASEAVEKGILVLVVLEQDFNYDWHLKH